MPRQNEDSSDIPRSELDMIEQAMNTMVQGTFSILFNSLFGADQNTDLGGTFENNVNMQQQSSSGMIGNDGSDFRRLANKSRQNRGTPTTSEEQDHIEESTPPPHRTAAMISRDEPDFQNRHHNGDMARITTPLPTMMNLLQFMLGTPNGPSSPSGSNETGTLLDLMLPSDDQLFNSMNPETIPQPKQVVEGDSPQKGGINWSFSSTSQRRVVQADGTEETYITRTQNGITETIKKIKYPDGSMEETIETGGRNSSNNSSDFLSRLATSAGHPIPSSDPNHATPSGGPLGSMWRRLFG
ncbi:hypothetical protein BDC45DRAFT_611030 [Circinella umbellata]|nr:hypothetical protein BDC45DRAFT_576618 [Circinella umbellata]KAI7847408.1 hypothetical protein BDC45DRAFT_611030 [Circinella umbellata]